jgi:hypothetical protein
MTEENSSELRQRTRAQTEELKSKMRAEELETLEHSVNGGGRTQPSVDLQAACGIHQAEHGFCVLTNRNVRALQSTAHPINDETGRFRQVCNHSDPDAQIIWDFHPGSRRPVRTWS